MPRKREPYRNRIELLQGTLDMLILQTLIFGPRHGYAIAVAIRAASSETLQVDTGSLYPALHRLERKKWIASSWGTTENNQRARIYKITAAGRTQLAAERDSWRRRVDAIASVLDTNFSETN